MRKCLLLFATLILVSALFAQQPNTTVEMADTFRSNGKIYVVVAVILTIFAGIIFYLIRLDRKVTRLERDTR